MQHRVQLNIYDRLHNNKDWSSDYVCNIKIAFGEGMKGVQMIKKF